MSAAPLRVAILGLGRMGRPAHFERLAGDARFKIIAVGDSDQAARQQAAASVGCPAYESLDALMNSPHAASPELVVNALPSHLHVDASIALLKQGRHVVVEKPLAPDADQARSVIQAAEQANRHLFVHHNYRFTRYTTLVQKIIQGGSIGRPFHIMANMILPFSRRKDWQTLRRMNGGILRNHGTHWIDLALFLLDEPVQDVWGALKLISDAGDAEDHAKVVFRGASGCVVEMLASSACRMPLPRLVIAGTCGGIVTDCENTLTVSCFDPACLPPIEVNLGRHTHYQGEPITLHDTQYDLKALAAPPDFYDNVYGVLRQAAKPVVALEQVVRLHEIIDQVTANGPVQDLRA